MKNMKILRQIYNQIVSEAYKNAPLECCGYLAGEDNTITKAYPMINMDKSRVHYSFSPEEQFKTVKQIRKMKLKVLAVYHSHPETPARPSEEDIHLAFDPHISYVIVSLYRKEADVRSFRIQGKQVEKEELAIQ